VAGEEQVSMCWAGASVAGASDPGASEEVRAQRLGKSGEVRSPAMRMAHTEAAERQAQGVGNPWPFGALENGAHGAEASASAGAV
jgi:hypothetical protein